MEKYFSKASTSTKRTFEEKSDKVINPQENLISDPGLRPPISSYDINQRDIIRRAYLSKPPCQPKGHVFPYTDFSGKRRRFNNDWFNEYEWLEYSIDKDAAFCLYCYLFPQPGCDVAFIERGFKYWKDPKRLSNHQGVPNGPHNFAKEKCFSLKRERQHIAPTLNRQSSEVQKEYRIRLQASVDCVTFLLHQGLSFRGHDECDESTNQGNFIELLKFLANHNEDINKVVLKNAPENLKLTAPSIQKDIVSAIANETTKRIVRDIKISGLFTLLLDESRDVSVKEQMAVVIRYLTMKGKIIESFLGIVHVSDTSTLSLKIAIDNLFSKFGLSIQNLRGQGYDGASNMRGEFNGLKTLIMKENSCAYYIHCFAHRLQLTLVSVAENHVDIASFFENISIIMNCVGGSCKRRDTIRAKEVERIQKELDSGEIRTGSGQNQELGMKRAGDTRWGSHYGALVNLSIMFSSVLEVLDVLRIDGQLTKIRAQANTHFIVMQTFDFVFIMLLMKKLLGLTAELSEALQRKDQDIVNAMSLVKIAKVRFNFMRSDDDQWEKFLEQVMLFCNKHNIEGKNMDEIYEEPCRQHRRQQKKTNLHRFRFEIYNTVIDLLMNELNDRFNEHNMELLTCAASLDPSDDFASFDVEKIMQLARFYPLDFTPVDVEKLENQLETYILDVRQLTEMKQLRGITELVEKLVEMKRDRVYHLLYRLLKLALLLPVATASVERVFSAMNVIKNRLRNRMGDDFMNDCLIAYIERDVANGIDNETILKHFQCMRPRRGTL